VSEQEGKFVQMLLDEAVRFLAPFAVGFVILILQRAASWAKVKVGDAKWKSIQDAVDFAVYAAEQTGASAGWLKQGKDKKDLAVALAQATLDKRGIKVDVGELEARIEAAVYDAYFPHAAETAKPETEYEANIQR
jgi:hypothetical protein